VIAGRVPDGGPVLIKPVAGVGLTWSFDENVGVPQAVGHEDRETTVT
jgi:hypothetical protein